MVPLEWRIHRSIPDDDGHLTSGFGGRLAIDSRVRQQLRGLEEEWDESGTSEIT